MRDVLPIFLSPWIIQDGNYGDFKVSEEYAFALEFHALAPLTATSTNPKGGPQLTYRGSAKYDVFCAKCLHSGNDWWVADFGVPAYTHGSKFDFVEAHAWLSGEIILGVDPFPYLVTST